MEKMRKLSEVIPLRIPANQITPEALQGVAFKLVRGEVVATPLGMYCDFTIVTEEDGREYTLRLPYDGYRHTIVFKLYDGPLGPATIVRQTDVNNNPYWLLTDVE